MKKLALLSLLPILFSCETVYQKTGWGKPDWFGEEVAESLIEHKLGADIDLSPQTPE